jgi:hypothetical protein
MYFTQVFVGLLAAASFAVAAPGEEPKPYKPSPYKPSPYKPPPPKYTTVCKTKTYIEYTPTYYPTTIYETKYTCKSPLLTTT